MKKRGILALLLACSFVLGAGATTACNIFNSPDSNQNQEEETTVKVTDVGLNKAVLNLKVGASETLIATVNPSNATNRNVSWQSDKPNIASVENGRVNAVAAGTAVITVTTADGGKTATCTVNVSENEPAPVRVESVSLNPSSKTLKVGESVTLTPTFTPSNPDNTNVTWSASSDAVTVVNGVVTANRVGSATVTVTTADGGKTANCNITVEASTPATVRVTGVEISSSAETIKAGATKQLTATVQPATASDRRVSWQSNNTAVATVDDNGLVTAKAAGSAVITVKTEDGNFAKTCTVTVEQDTPPAVDAKISYSYAGNECAAFEWGDSNAANATVQYKLKSASSYTTLSDSDKAYLVRQKNSATARVDLVGLQGGAAYDFKITTSGGETLTASNVTVHSYDRSGYAHFNKSDGVGAYNNDGTPKSNAVIVYVNEANKNTVTAKIGSKTYTGIVSILQNAGTSTPLIVRIVGTVGAATWTKGALDYNVDKKYNSKNTMSPDNVKGINGKALDKKNWEQAELISGGYNTIDTSVYSELKGLSSKIKYDSGKTEFDSAWNDCSIQNVKNVTVEGIGEDARIFQWGMTFKNSDSIEVRNITFEDYTEDACSFEGGDTSAKNLDAFNHGNIWVHHNVFEEGVNYWDVCKEQDKHDGDGSTDFKGLKNITLAYNVYNNTHKTGLIGGSNSQTTANVTFHHNAYNNCNARLPLARQANMHMYNNYYNCTTGTDISLRANAYAFVENCYFETNDDKCKDVKHIELQYEKIMDGDTVKEIRYGAAKLVGCVITQTRSRITVASDIDKSASLYIGNNRQAKVTHVNTFGHDFDTDSSLFYYDSVNKKSDVSVMFTADETKQYVPSLAGVQKHDGDVTLGGSGSGNGTTGGGTETPDPVDPTPTTGEAIVFNGDDFNGTLSVTKNGITITGTSDLSYDSNNKSSAFKYNDVDYGSVGNLYLSGGAKLTSDSPSKYLEFTATKAFKITVVAKGGAGRTLHLVKDKTEVVTFGAGASQETTTQTVNAGGTYRLGSTGSGIRIFYIIIEYID